MPETQVTTRMDFITSTFSATLYGANSGAIVNRFNKSYGHTIFEVKPAQIIGVEIVPPREEREAFLKTFDPYQPPRTQRKRRK